MGIPQRGVRSKVEQLIERMAALQRHTEPRELVITIVDPIGSAEEFGPCPVSELQDMMTAIARGAKGRRCWVETTWRARAPEEVMADLARERANG